MFSPKKKRKGIYLFEGASICRTFILCEALSKTLMDALVPSLATQRMTCIIVPILLPRNRGPRGSGDTQVPRRRVARSPC